MSYFLNNLAFFKNDVVNTFSEDHGVTVSVDRSWEKAYRQRWQSDKIVRSTHGVNCTGSCSWNVYVKNGLITWEIQATDYPRTRPDLPNHEPRGCQRGASYSWYLYSSARLKYPLIRSGLLEVWRTGKERYDDLIAVWESISTNKESCDLYKTKRGLGGFVRTSWDEVTDIIAAANIYTIKTFGPDRVVGFSPIPAMSMVSYAAGSRYLSLIGGACCSFYDWYCDLPPSSPQTWGEQTDVPESADWYNSSYIILWGSNVPQTRTPDAHFFTEVRYKGTKAVVITPDYSEASKLSDLWLAPKPGTDSALAMAMGHVILKEFYINKGTQSSYFEKYAKNYTDMPFLVILDKTINGYVPGRFIRAADFEDSLGVQNNVEWKTLVFDDSLNVCVPNGSIGTRWGESGKWNLELKDVRTGKSINPLLSLIDVSSEKLSVCFPYFASKAYKHFNFKSTEHDSILERVVPVRTVKLGTNRDVVVTTVFDLFVANYGVDRGLGGGNVAQRYEDFVPYTPFWQESITGVAAKDVISVAKQFAENAHLTEGRSMIIIGAGMNHWYHMDMNYRGVINLLIMCGCIGKSGGGWSHYVGQEKLRPQAGWLPLAFALDWVRPPRQMNGTSFFYNHTNQWRYEKLSLREILSPLANYKKWSDFSIIDCNVRSERMGWLPSCPQLEENPLRLTRYAEDSGISVVDYIIKGLRERSLKMSCEDPDNPKNFPRNLFVWRSNLFGSSGKGHEYFLKHLLGTQHGVCGKDIRELGGIKPKEVLWRDSVEGKLDLVVTLDFRMSTTCLYSDIVLPTASFYEKDDLNTSDMHPFIHPLQAAVDPVWESKTDWEIYKSIAKKFSTLVVGHLSVEKDVVLVPLLHDSPTELGQPTDVKEWYKGECELIPGKTMPSIAVVERNYPDVYKKFVSLGPLMSKLGNNVKGISWDTNAEVDSLKKTNRVVREQGVSYGLAIIDTAIDAAEVILNLAPETNGHVAVKSWESLSVKTGIDHTHLARSREHDKIMFRDVAAQPRKIISAPTWSGIESEEVSYNAGYTNVHELIPWRTLTGRQQVYQDHSWMRDFGEGLCVYRPPIDTKTINSALERSTEDAPYVLLNFITPHQKWGIHSTYTDNLLMLTLSRGGVIVWISEVDAKKIGVVDNDWVEAFNVNGSLVARAVVSQRVPEGMILQYHAQEKLMNVPTTRETTYRGGIHNSVTRVSTKPTHMIGGYAQQAYGFNYYGTVGSNRDEFIILKKLNNIIWKIKKNERAVYTRR